VKIAPIEFIFGEAAMRFNLDFLRLVREIRKLGRDERGHVAVIFTLLLVPLIGLTGGAIDYTRASAAKVAMQAALDATALALSKEAANLTQAQLTQKAHDYFLAAFNRPDAYDVKVNATYSNAAGLIPSASTTSCSAKASPGAPMTSSPTASAWSRIIARSSTRSSPRKGSMVCSRA
jgi:Flp pilus assembly protein TadG